MSSVHRIQAGAWKWTVLKVKRLLSHECSQVWVEEWAMRTRPFVFVIIVRKDLVVTSCVVKVIFLKSKKPVSRSLLESDCRAHRSHNLGIKVVHKIYKYFMHTQQSEGSTEDWGAQSLRV